MCEVWSVAAEGYFCAWCAQVAHGPAPEPRAPGGILGLGGGCWAVFPASVLPAGGARSLGCGRHLGWCRREASWYPGPEFWPSQRVSWLGAQVPQQTLQTLQTRVAVGCELQPSSCVWLGAPVSCPTAGSSRPTQLATWTSLLPLQVWLGKAARPPCLHPMVPQLLFWVLVRVHLIPVILCSVPRPQSDPSAAGVWATLTKLRAKTPLCWHHWALSPSHPLLAAPGCHGPEPCAPGLSPHTPRAVGVWSGGQGRCPWTQEGTPAQPARRALGVERQATAADSAAQSSIGWSGPEA